MNPFDSVLIWIVVIALCVAGILHLLKSRQDRPWGFKDVVKDPSYWEHASKVSTAADFAAQKAQTWDDATVDDAVLTYVFHSTSSRDAWVEKRILESLETRTHRQVLELLADTTRYKQWVTPTGKDILPEAPFHRACHLLGDAPPPEAIPLLAPFMDDENESIRREAARALGKTGHTSMVPLLRRALADPDEYVRTAALGGLQWARTTKSLVPETAAAIFDDVRQIVEKEQNGSYSADVLFILDAKRAEELFLSPAIFRPDSRILHEALKVLAEAKVSAPRERLRELIGQLQSKDLEYPKDYLLGQAARLLGSHRNPEDLKLLETLQQHGAEEVANGASLGILAWHGIEGFEERLTKRQEQGGYTSLTRPQQHYCSVFMLDAEINNGGLDQYFVNGSGDQWRDALEGLKAMNDLNRAGVLEEAAAKFGKDGPSMERRTRQRQLATIARANEDAFGELQVRYYSSKESIEVTTSRYVLANPEAFL